MRSEPEGGSGIQREMSRSLRIREDGRMIGHCRRNGFRGWDRFERLSRRWTSSWWTASAYGFIRRTLVQFRYHSLSKADRGTVRAYLAKMTGLSRAQLTRLIRQHRDTGRVEDRRGRPPAKPFERRYTASDIRLLAQVDGTLGQMSGPATRAVMRRQFEVFGKESFERLARLSNGHLYNLRQSQTYQRRRSTFTKTQPTQVAIGERRKPDPNGRPGFLRVDTVHQGDRDSAKGLYHINIVDRHSMAARGYGRGHERFLLPVLQALLSAYPFSVQGFHSDNGSEYINHQTANQPAPHRPVHQVPAPPFQRQRPGHAAVVPRCLGYAHIPKRRSRGRRSNRPQRTGPWTSPPPSSPCPTPRAISSPPQLDALAYATLALRPSMTPATNCASFTTTPHPPPPDPLPPLPPLGATLRRRPAFLQIPPVPSIRPKLTNSPLLHPPLP